MQPAMHDTIMFVMQLNPFRTSINQNASVQYVHLLKDDMFLPVAKNNSRKGDERRQCSKKSAL